jgi:hypothetical protein
VYRIPSFRPALAGPEKCLTLRANFWRDSFLWGSKFSPGRVQLQEPDSAASALKKEFFTVQDA